MRRILIVVVVSMCLLSAAAAAQVPQVAQVATLGLAALLGRSTVATAATTDAENAGNPEWLLVTHSLAGPGDAQVVDLPSGSIVPAAMACPEGWKRHVSSEGKELFFEFGLLVDESGTRQPDGIHYRLRACVKP